MDLKRIVAQNVKGCEAHGSIVVESNYNVILSITDCILDGGGYIEREEHKDITLKKFNSKKDAIKYAEKALSLLLPKYQDGKKGKDIDFILDDCIEVYT